MGRHSVQNRWIEGEPIAAATRGRALNPITKPVMTRQPPSNRWRRTKHQPRGFMVQPTGVHDERKAWAIAWLTPNGAQSVQQSTLQPNTPPHPPGGEGIWPAHSAREPMASPTPVPTVYAMVVSSQRRPEGRKVRHCSEPIGLTPQLPFARTMNLS